MKSRKANGRAVDYRRGARVAGLFPGEEVRARSLAGDGVRTVNDAVLHASTWLEPLRREMERAVVGQKRLTDRLLIALLTRSHVMVEGGPGLAKNLTLRTLASILQADFGRVPFNEDMTPEDLLGTERQGSNGSSIPMKRGPILTNLLLVDGFDRAPSRVRSALLEAMQERRVGMGEESFELPDPFVVLATRNRGERLGAGRLPDAQADRFLLHVILDDPTPAEERKILDVVEFTDRAMPVRPVVSIDELRHARNVVNTIYMDGPVKDYIVALVQATRQPETYGLRLRPYIRSGSSPRGSIGVKLAARAHAFLEGRGYVTPEDVKAVAVDVLRHRVTASPKADGELISSEDLVKMILDAVPVS